MSGTWLNAGMPHRHLYQIFTFCARYLVKVKRTLEGVSQFCYYAQTLGCHSLSLGKPCMLQTVFLSALLLCIRPPMHYSVKSHGQVRGTLTLGLSGILIYHITNTAIKLFFPVSLCLINYRFILFPLCFIC